jgi:hypothetical protein
MSERRAPRVTPPRDSGERFGVTDRGRTVWGVVVATTQNPLFEQLPSCEACGSPVFVLRYGLAADVLDLGDPRAWMVVERGCIIEPIAGGIHAANVCTACGRIGDLQTDRAIIWNVEVSSPVPKLVPALDRPVRAVYDAASWEDPGACDLFHFAALRGRWADDVALEAVAIARLLDAERRLQVEDYTDELRGRAAALLDDDRLRWIDRLELHAELGRDATLRDPEAGYLHLRAALQLAQDEAALRRFMVSDPDASWTYPDVPWLAIDTAEAAAFAGRNREALALLRWAVPACGDRDVAHGGAVTGVGLAAAAGDDDFELDCQLVLLEDLCQAWRNDDHDPVAAAWPRLEELVGSDPTGTRRRRAVTTIEGWYTPVERADLLRRLRA